MARKLLILASREPIPDRLLVNCYHDIGHVDFAAHASVDFPSGDGFEEQSECFGKLSRASATVSPLAGDIHFRTQGNVSLALAFDDRSQLPVHAVSPFRSSLLFWKRIPTFDFSGPTSATTPSRRCRP